MAYGPGFAAFYDVYWRSFGEDNGRRVLDWFDSVHPQSGRRVLDLCCGTGSSSDAFLAQGWRVVGVDLSPDMVAIAQTRTDQDGHGEATYLVGDVAKLDLGSVDEFDLIISLYDSLNHLPDLEALEAALTTARTYARPGAALVFDLNTEAGIRSWEATTMVFDDDTGTLVALGHYNEVTGEARIDLIGYMRRADGTFDRFTESAGERAFDTQDVVKAVERSGWTDVRLTTYDRLSETPAAATLPRVTVVAVNAAT